MIFDSSRIFVVIVTILEFKWGFSLKFVLMNRYLKTK